MSERLDMLLLEKNTYENSNDNEFLQQRELKSIARCNTFGTGRWKPFRCKRKGSIWMGRM